eukprot:gene28377-31511_t
MRPISSQGGVAAGETATLYDLFAQASTVQYWYQVTSQVTKGSNISVSAAIITSICSEYSFFVSGLSEIMRVRSAVTALQALQRARSGAVTEVARSGSLALFGADADATGFRSVEQLNSIQARNIFTSVPQHAEPVTNVPVEGDVAAVLKQIDDVVSSETVHAKDVADAAVSLAYLQAKGDRRAWGKVFEAALTAKDSFDGASLSAFMWAATTAGVDHFKTVYELSGVAGSMLKSFTPTQLSLVVEALGKAHVKDSELFGKVADIVSADVAKFKPSELARILYGFGASCQNDPKLVSAVSKALAAKASELTAREAVQAMWALAKLRSADKATLYPLAVWALAKLRSSDKATLDPLVKAAGSKMGSAESGVDAAALAWSIGYLGYKADAATAKAVAASLKASAADLAPSHAIDAAWGLAVAGNADQAAVSALFDAVGAAVDKAPESFDVYQLGALYNAAMLVPGAKLPAKVLNFSEKIYALGAESIKVLDFSEKMYALGAEAIKVKRTGAVQGFRADLAQAAARASGARYQPEIVAAVAGFAKTTPEGILVDISMELDPSTKVAIEAVGPACLSASGALLGPAVARAKLLEAKGYKVVSVPISAWAGLTDSKAKAAFLLKAIKAAVPAASSKVGAMEAKLNAPFDAYAE